MSRISAISITSQKEKPAAASRRLSTQHLAVARDWKTTNAVKLVEPSHYQQKLGKRNDGLSPHTAEHPDAGRLANRNSLHQTDQTTSAHQDTEYFPHTYRDEPASHAAAPRETAPMSMRQPQFPYSHHTNSRSQNHHHGSAHQKECSDSMKIINGARPVYIEIIIANACSDADIANLKIITVYREGAGNAPESLPCILSAAFRKNTIPYSFRNRSSEKR